MESPVYFNPFTPLGTEPKIENSYKVLSIESPVYFSPFTPLWDLTKNRKFLKSSKF